MVGNPAHFTVNSYAKGLPILNMLDREKGL